MHMRSRGQADGDGERPGALAVRASGGASASSGARRTRGCSAGSCSAPRSSTATQTVLLVLVAQRAARVGTDGVGVFYAALGIGGVIGAALVSRLARSARLGAIALRLPAADVGADGAARARPTRAAPRSRSCWCPASARSCSTCSRSPSCSARCPSDVLGRVWGALDALVVAAIIVGSHRGRAGGRPARRRRRVRRARVRRSRSLGPLRRSAGCSGPTASRSRCSRASAPRSRCSSRSRSSRTPTAR